MTDLPPANPAIPGEGPELLAASPEPIAKPAIPSLFRSASLIAVVTIVSKILGLVRDQMIAHAYGASLISDAYLYAFQIPSFSLVLLGGLGGPFHTATVSVLSKLLKDDESPTAQAQILVNTFITITGLAFAALSIIAFFAAPLVIECIAHQATPELKTIAAQHLRWMSPIIFLGGIIGIFYGVANVYHRFLWPSLSPSAINVSLIGWLLAFGPDTNGVYALAASTLVGAVLQVGLQLPDYFRTGFRLFPAFHWRDTDLKTMGELLFPATIGTTIGQLNIYVAMFFISQLEPGGWTATMLGNRLIQLPIGVLIIAMLVPLFPRFSRWVGEKDFNSLRASFRDGILTLWMLSFPIMALIFLVGRPAVSVLFERGAFTAHDTTLVTSVLMVLSLSIVPYMLRDGITRIFYAFNDSRTPLIAGLTSIVINAVLNAILVGPYGVAGVAFSTVIVTICNATILSLLVRKHIQDLELRKLWAPCAVMIVATLLASGAGYGVNWALTQQLYPKIHLASHTLQAAITLLSVTVVLVVVYFSFLIFFRNPLAIKFLQRTKLLKRGA